MSRFIPQLTGAHALVTGGTKGIGRVIVETLLSEGVSVSYCSRNVRGDEFANFKDATDGARAVGTSVDISNAASIQGWVEASAKDIDDWEKSFHADVLGLVNLINASEPHLEKRNGAGSVIVISSLAGFEARHPAIRGPYTTLKRAQATLAKDFGRWLGPKGIRINTIVPGTIDSPPVDKPDGTVELSQFQQIMTANPDFLKSLIDSIPLGKVGQAQDIANAVVFLGSSLGRYVNGVNLIVDGGMSTAL
ncbi:Dehydrogenase/reductase SDR family member 4 [Fusarium oxysporum f. sp. cubense race 1]|uniref:Dehydrogenase/reductase SDR family member 4 n=1 Tax=Fusarium oxysporum f. sp. cubense (strain race 1) TaxID=1229664 RepID=N4U935_FUSC1|nr:Dehydrogenase/reductase SDR family member 4 [Fusarium oxysporum f. sp. cubense race 1]